MNMKERFLKLCEELTSDMIEQVFDECGYSRAKLENLTDCDILKMFRYVIDRNELQGESIRDLHDKAIELLKPEGMNKITDEEISNLLECFNYVGYPRIAWITIEFLEEKGLLAELFTKIQDTEKIDERTDEDDILNLLVTEVIEMIKNEWNSGHLIAKIKC